MGENDFSRLELSLPAFRENYRYFRSLLEPGTRLLVLVKANAYGLGAVEFATMLQNEGADYLAVALPIEGVELRRNGITLPILVLTAGTDFFEQCVDYRLEPSIPNLYTLKALVAVLERRGVCRLKSQTVARRDDHAAVLLHQRYRPGHVHHFLHAQHIAAAVDPQDVSEDPSQDSFTMGQIKMFSENSAALGKALGYMPLRHILNSAGIERFPQYQFDMVRLGIGIYGISALPSVQLAPVASLKVKILQIKHLKESDGTIGYGRWGKIPHEGATIATIPCGYADGLDRRLGRGRASFSVNGHRAPTIGNICMDMCMLDVSGIDCAAGDTVTIFGKDPTITELADILDTIPYEILTSVPRRIERIIVRKPSL